LRVAYLCAYPHPHHLSILNLQILTMSPGCCAPAPNQGAHDQSASNQVWNDGRFAIRHNCSGCPESEACVSLLNDQKQFIGCYNAASLSGVSLDGYCFKTCATANCGEKRPHVHGFQQHCSTNKSKTYADKIKEVLLIKCDSCNTPPKLGYKAGQTAEGGAKAGHVTLDTGDATSVSTVMEVSGICCPSEVPIIEKILKKLPGIEEVRVNVTAKSTTVQHNPLLTSPAELVIALNTASLGARLTRENDEPQHSKWPSPLLMVCGILWVVSLGHLADEEDETWVYKLKYVALGAVVMGFPRIAMKAWGALKNTTLDINCLMIIAATGAVAIGDFSEAAAVVFLFGLSEWLEDMATAKARNALSALLSMKPESATFASSGEKVPVEQVKLGDVLAVRAGEKVPVDGVVSDGQTSVDEAALTGESAPVEKRKGAKVSAGSINVGGGYMEVECTAVAKDSAVARMVRLIEDANASRSKTEKRVEMFAQVYTPVVVVLAMLLAIVPWFFLSQEEATEWLYTALVLLVVSCPCALVISTPVTYVSTLSTAATHSILIRGGEHLETLGRIAAIGLDKTGTLTEGRFAVRKVLGPFDGKSIPKDMPGLLSLMAAVETKSTHPVASALVRHAQSEGANVTLKAIDMKDTAGEGVEAFVNGIRVQVGSRRLAKRMGWGLGEVASAKACFGPLAHFFGVAPASNAQSLINIDKQVIEMEEQGQTVCYLGIAGNLAAVFGVADAPRAEAAQAVKELRSYGVETVMLTGDRSTTAKAIAKMLNITNIKAELLPEDKVTAVTQLKQDFATKPCLPCFSSKEGAVAMVGDGINDAAALAASDVGVAMGAAGTQVAMENAHVILMDSDLLKLVLSVKLGRYAVRKIKQNISFAMVSKIVMVAITMAGYASLWGAILADLGAMLIVTVNASMVLGLRRKVEKRSHAHVGGNTDIEKGACATGCCAPEPIKQNKFESAHDDGHGHGHGHGHGGHGHAH